MRRSPLSAGTKKRYAITEENGLENGHGSSDDEDIAGELKEMKVSVTLSLY